jgi:hypothetical protein
LLGKVYYKRFDPPNRAISKKTLPIFWRLGNLIGHCFVEFKAVSTRPVGDESGFRESDISCANLWQGRAN